MTFKQKIRAMKQLKQRLRRACACVTCGPMLKFPEPSPGSQNAIEVNCISCGRTIRFDFAPDDLRTQEAMDSMVQSFVTGRGLCPHACTISIDGEMWKDDPECSCGKDRAFFQFVSSGKSTEPTTQE
jgi:hypothetical protein